MRFLFVNQYYAPDYAATAQQLQDLCEELAGSGHEVHVLASRALYDGRDIELPGYEILNGVHVHRVPLASSNRNCLRDRAVGYLSFYARAFAKAHTVPRPDVVVTLTTPPMISLLGGWLRLFRRSRFVYWVMDIYPDIALRAGVLSPYGPVRALWSALGRVSYKIANRVVVLGEDMKQVLAAKGVSPAKVDVLNSWSCSKEIQPVAADANTFRQLHIVPGRFSLMYSGNMGMCHTFQSVIAGIRDHLAEEGRHQFLFVGGGKRAAEVREALKDSPDAVTFLPYQDRSVLAESLSAPDAHLITLDPHYDGLLVPSKLYGILAAGRPVLFVGSAGNEVARIIEHHRCGIRVESDDPAGFVSAVRRLADNPEEARAMGQRGRQAFLSFFDRRHACDEFRQLLEREALRPGIRGSRHTAAAGRPSPVRRASTSAEAIPISATE